MLPLKKSIYIFLLLLLFTVGCGNNEPSNVGESLSVDNLAVHKVGDKKQTIYYGMAKKDAEKLLGTGNKATGILGDTYSYKDDLSLSFRDEKVVCITLEEGSKFTTANGAEVGMTKDEIKELYGDKNAVEVTDYDLNYMYNFKDKKFIKSTDNKVFKDREAMTNTYQISISFNDNGKSKRIMLLDHAFAYYMN